MEIKWPEKIDKLTIVSGFSTCRESDAYLEGYNKAIDACKQAYEESTKTTPSR